MIPGFHRQDQKKRTTKRYNTLVSTNAVPEIFRRTHPGKKETVRTAKSAEKLKKKLFALGLASAFMSILVISLIFYETELIYSDSYILTDHVTILRSFILILCMAHALLIFKIQTAHLQINLSFIDKARMLWTSRELRMDLLIEVGICMIHTPPGLPVIFKFYQMGYESTLSFTDVIFPLCLLRCYFFIGVLTNYSSYNNPRTRVLLPLLMCKYRTSFLLKCFINSRPFRTGLLCCGFSLLIFSANVRVFEKSVSDTSLWDEMWLSFVTESTIGYGDYYPQTHFGRLFCGVAGIFGIFIFSYNVMAVKEFTDLTKEELEMSKIIRNKKIVASKLRPKAVILIQRWWTARKTRRVAMLFRVDQEARRFGFMRKCLKSNLDVNLEEHIRECGDAIGNKFRSSFKVFKNLVSVSNRSKSYMQVQYTNLKKLKKYVDKCLDTEENESYVGKTLQSPQKAENIVKLRSKAVKNMLFRKSGVIPNLSASPSISVVDFDQE